MGCSRLSNVHARQRGYIFNRMASPMLKEKQQPANGIPHKLVGGIYAGPYSAYVNYIRRAGCPHPAASSRGYPSTGSHPRRGRRPRRPGNLPSPPIPGNPPGRACPAPTARRRASPLPSANARGGVKTPPYGPPHQRVPAPRRAAVRERRQKNRGDPFSRDCLGSLYKI